jgi:hypothetical protein
MRRGATLVTSAVALGALLWPALDPTPVDSLPISSYPMFARPKRRVSRYPLVVLRDESGRERRLDAQEIGGTDEPMQAAMTVSQAIRTGTAPELCAEIAGALAERGTVEIVTAGYDAIAWFEGRRDPVDRRVHASCAVRVSGVVVSGVGLAGVEAPG